MVALAIINVPYLFHEYTVHRAATDGVPVTATVVEGTPAGSDVELSFKLPVTVDKDQKVRTVKVDHAAGLQALQTKQIVVRVLDGNPAVFHVDGQVASLAPLTITLVADALILLSIVVSWRFGGRLRRPSLEGVALEDVAAGVEGSLLDRQPDGTYLVNGEVTSTGPGSLVLTLRDRDVLVELREHANPIAVGERARVLVHLVG